MVSKRRGRRAFTSLLVAFAIAAVAASASSAAPSCAEGPQTTGNTIVGTPCDDTIHAPRGITAVYGEGGGDSLFGGRGNESLFGGEGNDRLYGGIGDDRLRAGPGDDLLSGGFGADSLDGEGGSDTARGDATIDRIGDSGPATDSDTLSFATGVTPGFPNAGDFGFQGFPESAVGRGVFIELGQDFANDGLAPSGGGVDEPLEAASFESFESVIGTPFSDLIVGGSGDETIYGGGGADVLRGAGGSDQIFGGAEGDYCEGEAIADCEFSGSDHEVDPRAPSTIAVGVMAPQSGANPGVYLTGSEGDDEVTAGFGANEVTFELGAGSEGGFDAGETAAGGCSVPSADTAVCSLSNVPDALVMAGLLGEDSLSIGDFPETASPVLLGGEGADALVGAATEDALVDGAGDDSAGAAGGDDAVPNNPGGDQLSAGTGDDLFISNAVCEGDTLDGGEGTDNANWANFGSAVALDLGVGLAGLAGPGGTPTCPSGLPTTLQRLEDIEGSNHDDALTGDSAPNQLLGRQGADIYHAVAGNDSILANSGDSDAAIDCGEGFDTAQIDIPTGEYADPAPVACEAVYERPPNSFRPPDTPPDPNPPPDGASGTTQQGTGPSAPDDRTPPGTRVLRRPNRLLFSAGRRLTVVFAFASNEAGARFRCRLDRRRPLRCASPRSFSVGLGPHVLRVVAIDRAGNADPTPAVVRFRVRQR
jgi:Ca2+-binding RTX toxin-like protein